jgi:hypothetical protein
MSAFGRKADTVEIVATRGIGAWTDDEIKRAIVQGISRDGSKLKPPMGYHYYSTVSTDDLDAIVAYLRTVPAKD